MKFINQAGTFLILAICWLSIAHANVDGHESGPQEAVEQAANQVIAVLEKEGDEIRGNPDKIYSLVNDHILPHFDFDKMSYFVLGNAWKSASEQQQHDFQDQFKHLLIRTYTTALSEYSTDGDILYKKVLISPKNENIAIVQTEIRQKGRGPIEVSYRMYRTVDVWRIYDVSIGGVSLVKNYRANFAGQVRSKGLDGLISSLSEHNQPQEDVVTVKPASQIQ